MKKARKFKGDVQVLWKQIGAGHCPPVTSHFQDEIIPLLWGMNGNTSPFPANLIGATIVQLGHVSESRSELVIEYRTNPGDVLRRVVFTFDDHDMWVRSQE